MLSAFRMRLLIALPLNSLALAGASHVQAAFINDSTATLSGNNLFFHRDFRDGHGQSRRQEWGQGFVLDMRSGYTDGSLGVGLDALATLGIKLDSGRGHAGTGLLPIHDDGRAADEFSRLGLAGKVRFSATELRYGAQLPKLPLIKSSTSRLLPQIFHGAILTSRDLDPSLTLTLARMDRVTNRNASGQQPLGLKNANGRFRKNVQAGQLNLGGLDWHLSDDTTVRYYFADLENVYRQHYVGLVNTQPAGPGLLSSDLRLIETHDSGAARGGRIDNRALNALLSYKLEAHTLSLGWQAMGGKTGFAYLDGSSPYLVNSVQINDFDNAHQQSWQAGYDFNFKYVGVPGLHLNCLYVTSNSGRISSANSPRGTEWERDVELKYVVQSGPLKDLYVRMRNATFRSHLTRSADENRLIVGYSLPIW